MIAVELDQIGQEENRSVIKVLPYVLFIFFTLDTVLQMQYSEYLLVLNQSILSHPLPSPLIAIMQHTFHPTLSFQTMILKE